MHHSIFPTSEGYKVERCTVCCTLFHCPLCPKYKPSQRGRLQKHLDVHVKNAITFKDLKICKCSLDCRNTPHFHCPCDKTVIRRADMEKHLQTCHTSAAPDPPLLQPSTLPEDAPCAPPTTSSAAPPTTSSAAPPTTSSAAPPTTSSAAQPTTSSAAQPTTSSAAPPTTSSAAPPTTSSAAQPTTSSAAQPTTSSSSIQHTSSKKAKCSHCGLICLAKNLNKHIHRKHRKKKNSDGVLRAICVDATNGISAVQKASHGFSVPIHVQKKTWGHLHKVQCELEECRQYHLMALRSGLTFSQCEHIRSLDHCREIATEEWLKDETLEEMVSLKFFGEAKKATCKKRQQQAQKDHVPLCVEVSFQKNPTQYCLSVHEPALHHYSRLGRVMVTYNSTAHT
ncbi:uncharacterized protein [Paralichthys olivaceus]|uniref:uncharacterized protein n=1 Tax=Paralichthys olivaceus TaxID=8255 RepID=UPI0037532F36